MKNLSICRRYKILPKRWLQCSVAIALALAFFGIPTTGFSPVQALGTNLLTVRGTSTATTSAGTSIAIGDVFNWVATFDLDTPSTGSTPSYGNKFNDSLTAFSLTKSSANTGTWNPSGINWPITPASNVDANANGNGITVQLRPTNAPAINSQAFFDVGVSFGWSSSDLDAVWVSGSTTLSTWLGTNSPNLNSAYLRLELRDNSYSSASFTSTLTSSTTTTTLPSTSSTTALNSPSSTTSSTITASSIVPTTTARFSGQSTPAATMRPGPSTTALPLITTTTTATSPPSTSVPPESAPEAPEAEPGKATAVVNGQQIALNVTRQNNSLQVTSGNIKMNIKVINKAGGIVPLDKNGNVSIEKGSKFEFTVTGAKPSADLEAWLFSDPVKLGNRVVDAFGNASATLTVANKVAKGPHRFVTRTYSNSDEAVTLSVGIIGASSSNTPIRLIIFIVLITAVCGGLFIPAVLRRRNGKVLSKNRRFGGR